MNAARELTLCVLGLLASLLAVRALAGPVATLDLTSRADAEPHFLVFCGRNNSATGHAFVAWGREDAQRRMSVSDGAFGLYPQRGNSATDTVKMVFAAVPGEIAQEEVRRSLAADLIRLIVRVDRSTYAATLALKGTWAARTDYQLLERDCVTFASEIARATGLTLPARDTTDRPWGYLEKLIAANPQSAFYAGEWTSNDPARRFTLKISGDTCEWTERNAAGATFVRTVPLVRADGQATVSRPNDEAALKFLGFQPALRVEILARAPRPSYLQLTRTAAGELRAKWFGLSVTKDAQARLADLRQPGTQPGADFIFAKRE